MEASTKQIMRDVSLIWEDIEDGPRKALSSENQEFLEILKQNVEDRLKSDLSVLLHESVDYERSKLKKDFDCFQILFDRFLRESGPSIDWNRIKKLPSESMCDYADLEAASGEAVAQLLKKVVVVKLNGGLGTSMGCKGPKSAIPVRGDLTFLDLTVQQIEHLNQSHGVDVPLVLMNSFNTDDDTEKIIRKYHGRQVRILTFEQSCYPRIHKDTLLPVAKDTNVQDSLEAWYPPGHGDFYESLKNSGLLDKFLAEGLEYCFVSNVDNLGATVDLKILNVLVNSPDNRPEFLMEITDKTTADVKGGTLIEYDDTLRLLEIAQVPKERVNDFKSVKTFKYFNTNNLWIKLDAIDRVVSDGSLSMEIIVNPKTLRDGVPVIQLETAIGAAMKCFRRGLGVRVPRSRFLPVKKTSDLLLVMSDLYELQHGALVMSPRRVFPMTPSITLGGHFVKNREFMSRFASIPGVVDLDHLTVSGDVTFGKGVTLKGTVIIVSALGDNIDIPAGSVLENKVVTGNLRILDH